MGKPLTRREKQVRDLVLRGLTRSQVGKLLGCGTRTIETHINSVRKKYNVKNNIELVRAAYQITEQEGICDP